MAASHPITDEIPAGTIVHGHRIVRALGAGQMGEVYEATAEDGSSVAIKLLVGHAVMDTALLKRFEREAKVCRELKSPHIVPVLDHGVHAGRPLLVMRLLRGADLEKWLERTGPLRPGVAVAIILQACDALAVAHARGVVHRDLKPANIFINEGHDGAVWTIVCDFGVAKTLDEDGLLTASGAVLGTPLYMAPEQLLDSKRVDTRCDVWALGMTLYHALAGRAALSHVESLADLVLALSTCNITPLQSIAPWIAPSLARVVHAALLPRDKRLPTVEELASALRRWGPTPEPLRTSALVGAYPEDRALVATIATLPTDHRELGKPDDATVDAAAEQREPPDVLAGKTLGDKYRLVRRLGYGGMGAVYEAVDPSNQRTAVKVMHAESGARSADASRRFIREMRAVRAIDSPHVVKPIDFGVDEKEGIPFFVMELLSGRDVASVLAAIGSLAPNVAVELFVQACEALQAAHVLGIVHRDIKPSNLFLHEPGGGAVVLKVCDFGIAKRVEADVAEASTELTRTGGLLGSPLYMSPEHAKNAKNVDARSDVWSLGLSLHEALSGERPWQGRTSIGEVIVAICTEEVPPLGTVAPWVDMELAAVIHRSLARDPASRWASTAEFGAALRQYGLGRAVRVEDLKPAANAQKTSASARSVPPPGSVTSGSLAAAARPAGDASISLPLERRSAWKWALAGAAAIALTGGVVGVRVLAATATHDAAGEGVASAGASGLPTTSAIPLASAVTPPPSASASSFASAAAVDSATAAVAPPGGRPRVRPPTPLSPASAVAAPPVSAPVPAAASAQAAPRNDGRMNSRKDDGK